MKGQRTVIGFGFAVIPLVLITALWVGAFVFWIVVIVEVAKIPDMQFRAAGSEKIVWLLIVILAGIIGSLVWWFAKRDGRVASRGQRPATAARLVPGGCHWNPALVGRIQMDRHPSFPSSHPVAGSRVTNRRAGRLNERSSTHSSGGFPQ